MKFKYKCDECYRNIKESDCIPLWDSDWYFVHFNCATWHFDQSPISNYISDSNYYPLPAETTITRKLREAVSPHCQ